MIKNLLYSIFFHFLLVALIYANFNLKVSDNIQTNQVSISMVSKEDFESRFKIPKEEKEKKFPKKKSSKKEKEEPTPEVKTVLESDPKTETKNDPKPTSESPIPVEEKPKKEEREIKKEEKEVIAKEEKKEKIEETKKIPEKTIKEEKTSEKEDKKEEKKQKEEKILEDSKSNNNEQQINNLESLNLSVREKFNIRSQLTTCYRRSLEENNLEEDKISIIVSVEISRDGFIKSNLEDNLDDRRYNEDVNYKTIVNNVRRALNFCSPLRNLPVDKYDVWKQVSLEFGKIEEQKNK